MFLVMFSYMFLWPSEATQFWGSLVSIVLVFVKLSEELCPAWHCKFFYFTTLQILHVYFGLAAALVSQKDNSNTPEHAR
jgi:hypothetical protein